MGRKLVLLIVLGAILAAAVTGAHVRAATITPLISQDAVVSDTLAVSPDGSLLAYVTGQRDGTQCVVVNGAAAPTERRPPTVESVQRIVFSSLGDHWAVLVTRDGEQLVIWDGKETLPCAAISSFRFSASGHDILYVETSLAGESLDVDGVAGPPYDAIASPLFSADGRHTAYVASAGSRTFTVLDGVEGKDLPDGANVRLIGFSPDGLHLVYVVQQRRTWQVGIRETTIIGAPAPKEWLLKPCDEVGEVAFSSDGKRFAYAARNGRQWQVNIEDLAGKTLDEGLLYDRVMNLFFPQGNNTPAYIATKDKQDHMVKGPEGPGYGSIKPLYPSGIPDTANEDYGIQAPFVPADGIVGYFAEKSRNKWVLVLGGEEKPNVVDPTAYVSPDRKHWACVEAGADRGTWQVLRDGVETGAPYDDVRALTFSADGAHLAWEGVKGRQSVIVLDGVEQPGSYDAIRGFAFSPDGTHLVAAVKQGKRECLVVDGVAGNETYDALLLAPAHDASGQAACHFTSNDSYVVFAEKDGEIVEIEGTVK